MAARLVFTVIIAALSLAQTIPACTTDQRASSRPLRGGRVKVCVAQWPLGHEPETTSSRLRSLPPAGLTTVNGTLACVAIDCVARYGAALPVFDAATGLCVAALAASASPTRGASPSPSASPGTSPSPTGRGAGQACVHGAVVCSGVCACECDAGWTTDVPTGASPFTVALCNATAPETVGPADGSCGDAARCFFVNRLPAALAILCVILCVLCVVTCCAVRCCCPRARPCSCAARACASACEAACVAACGAAAAAAAAAAKRARQPVIGAATTTTSVAPPAAGAIVALTVNPLSRSRLGAAVHAATAPRADGAAAPAQAAGLSAMPRLDIASPSHSAIRAVVGMTLRPPPWVRAIMQRVDAGGGGAGGGGGGEGGGAA